MKTKQDWALILGFIVVGLVLFSASNVLFENLIVGNIVATSRGSCYDTDGNGPNRDFVKGSISGIQANGNNFERTDYCIDKFQLREYRCDFNPAKPNHNVLRFTSSIQYCKKGCLNGACLG